MKLLINHWKNIILILLVAVCILNMHSCGKRGEDYKSLENAYDISRDSTKYYKDDNGDLVAQRTTQNLTIQELKKHGDELGFDKKALKKQVGNLNRLVSNLKGEISVKDRIISQVTNSTETDTTIVGGDTLYIEKDVLNFSHEGKYLQYQGKIIGSELTFDYNYNVVFDQTTYWEPAGLFKPLRLVTDFKIEDPNAKAVKLNSVVIRPPRKKFYQTTGFKIGVGFLGGAILFRK